MKTTTSMRLLDAIRAGNGNCTDYRAGKLLGTSTSAISRWRTGVGHMNPTNIAKACELAGFSEQNWEWQIRIGAEREQGPDGDIFRDAVKDLDALAAGGKPAPDGILAMAARALAAAKKAGKAITLIAGLAVALLGLAPQKPALADTSAAYVAASTARALHQVSIFCQIIKILAGWGLVRRLCQLIPTRSRPCSDHGLSLAMECAA